jgi:lipoprotein-releasing system permease protein
LASIISVTLGVATMIVVNSVMAGFADKMRERLHGILADLVVESASMDGFYNYEEVMARIKEAGGDDIEAMAPTLETPAILKYRVGSQYKTNLVQLIGIHPQERAKTGDFAEFLFDERGERIPPSFEVPESMREQSPAGMRLKELEGEEDDAFNHALKEQLRQQAREQVPDQGAIMGYALATWHSGMEHKDVYLAHVGSKFNLAFPKSGRKPEPGTDEFTLVGYFKSGMSEYDATHVYVPLEQLQKSRGMIREADGKGAVNQIQIKVKPGVDLDNLAERLQLGLERLQPMFFKVWTWEQKQGPLLGAVAIEQSILNILLFLIIAVAGFGILAIFSMIVVEKTRDIGILKALGASTSGIRGIFLAYGLMLGIVGSGAGMIGGLLFVRYINEIEKVLSAILQHKVFDDTIYYFDKIPTVVEPRTLIGVVLGALVIAVLASIWPAQRAARLHPVKALRFE